MLPISIRHLGLQPYLQTLEDMHAFTNQRDSTTIDELWVLEHPPVFTLGQSGQHQHLLNPDTIPVIQTDRGGQVTYHGPGQLIIYVLLDLKRRKMGIRELVSTLENAIIHYLNTLDIEAYARPDAPGVYIQGAKIASLGLRVRRGCSFHGLAFNLAMDLEPFSRINPCGQVGLIMTQLSEYTEPNQLSEASSVFLQHLCQLLGYCYDRTRSS